MKLNSASKVATVSILLACFAPSLQVSGKDEKIKPEQLLAKHLEAIGSTEARAVPRTRLIEGASQVNFRLGGQGQMDGKGNILSSGPMVRLGLSFAALDYPGEQLAFDGKKVTVGQIRPGTRSALSAFIYQHDGILKEGLIFGVLTTSWALLHAPARQPKLEYNGLKKIDGISLHELRYRARRGLGDVNVMLYFEPETFRHVRSQHRVVVPANMGASPAESASMRDSIYLLVEKFSDFETIDGLTLPHAYDLSFTIEGQNATLYTTWHFSVSKIGHNQEIDPKYFAVQ
jgi:hypothetical protein